MKRLIITSVVVIVLMSCLVVITSSVQFQTKIGTKVRDEFVYQREKFVGILQCAYRCERDNHCSLASYNHMVGSCQLSNRTLNSDTNLLTNETVSTVMSLRDNGTTATSEKTTATSTTTEDTTTSTTEDTSTSTSEGTTVSTRSEYCSLPCVQNNKKDANCFPIVSRFTRKCVCKAGYNLQTVCSQGWTKLAESCYYFIEQSDDFNGSMETCKQINGRLAEPETNATFESLRTYMVDNLSSAAYWFGLKTIVNGTFVWSSNDQVPLYDGWPARERVNVKTDDICGRLKKDIEYRWSDNQCSRSDGVDGAVCEKEFM